MGPGAYFANGTFLNLTRSTSALGYNTYFKWHIKMLQCRIWDRGAGNVGVWEALISACAFLAPFKIPMFHTRGADRIIKPCNI